MRMMIAKTSLLLLLSLFAWVQTCDYYVLILIYQLIISLDIVDIIYHIISYKYQEAPLKLSEKEETTSLKVKVLKSVSFSPGQ